MATTADINGGTADNVVIGGSTPAAGTFSSLTATTANIDGGTIDGVSIGSSSTGAGAFSTLTVGGASVLTSVAFSNLDAGAVTTSSETFSDVDNQIPTNAAVIDYVAATIPLISEVNDLSSVVTWANVPDANITESSVTQHQAALAITPSQIAGGTSPTISATASGALANGDKVILNTNGTVTKAQITSYTPTLGTEVVFRDSSTTYPDSVYSTAVDRVIFSSRGKQVYSGIVSADGSTISVGSGTGYGGPSHAGGVANYLDMAYDSNLDRVVLAYSDSDNSSKGTCAVVQPLSNGSFTVSSTVTGNIFDSGSVAHVRIVYDANAQKVIVAYRESSVGKAVVGTVATDTSNPITFGTPVNFNGGSSAENMAMSYDANAQKIVIAYTDTSSSDHGKAVVGTVSGTSISFGTPATFNSNGTPYVGIAYDANAQKHLIAFRDNSDSNSGKGIVGTVSGTSISFGSATQFETGEANFMDAAYIEDQQKVGVVYQDNGDSNKGKYVLGTISGTSVSFTTPAIFNDGTTNYMRATYTPDQDAFIISYQDGGNSSKGTGVTVYQVANSNVTSTNYIGISDGAYSDGAAATIQIVGAVDDAQSSLTTGSQYYLQQDGTLSTTADTPSVYAGTAISSTKLAIQHPEVPTSLPLVLIASATASSSTEIDLTGMTSAYKIYKVYFAGSPSADMRMRVRFFVDGSIADSNNTYANLGINSTGSSAGVGYSSPFNENYADFGAGSTWNDHFVGELTINASGDSSYGGVIAQGSIAALYNTSGLRNSHVTIAHKSGANQITGIRMYPSGGNFATGNFYLFGVNA